MSENLTPETIEALERTVVPWALDTNERTEMKPLGDCVQPGMRVKVVRDTTWNGPWPSEPTGIIDPKADAPVRIIDLATMPEVNVPDDERGSMREFLVRFDEPQRDGDGAGPYYEAAIWEKYLRLID